MKEKGIEGSLYTLGKIVLETSSAFRSPQRVATKEDHGILRWIPVTSRLLTSPPLPGEPELYEILWRGLSSENLNTHNNISLYTVFGEVMAHFSAKTN